VATTVAPQFTFRRAGARLVCAFTHVAGNSNADPNAHPVFPWVSKSHSNANTHSDTDTYTLANSYSDSDTG
jgi:phage-related protein